MTMMLAACSSTDPLVQYAKDVDNLTNTKCGAPTRAALEESAKMKLTRTGKDINCELIDYGMPCDMAWEGGFYVDCRMEEGKMKVNFYETTHPELGRTCMCYINIYFTVRDVEEDEFMLMLRDKEVGMVSFKEHSTVYIDLWSNDMSYDKDFDYKPVLTKFNYYEETSADYINDEGFTYGLPERYFSISSANDHLNKSIGIYYSNFALPCEMTKLDMVMDEEEDGTLVLRFVTDHGQIDSSDKPGCDRMGFMSARIHNPPKECHLKVNPHTVKTTGEDGVERDETVYDYDGLYKFGDKIRINF